MPSFWKKFFITLLLVIMLIACGNLGEVTSCQKGCKDDYNLCLMIIGTSGTAPGGATADPFLLFLSCESSRTVCEDTCGGTGRL